MTELNDPTLADPSSLPARPIGRTLVRLARQVELGAATAELSLSQYRVLSLLDGGHEAASVLAEKLAVSRPSITGIVDGLLVRGFVRRDSVHGDRRRVDICLTAAGAEALAAADAAIEARLATIATYADPDAGDLIANLAPWGEAVSAYRRARRAEKGCDERR